MQILSTLWEEALEHLTRLNRYRDDMRKVKVKAGTSAGAIYMGYHTFYLTKDDYILAIPEMLHLVGEFTRSSSLGNPSIGL